MAVSEDDGSLHLSRLTDSGSATTSPHGWTAQAGWFAFIENESRVWAYDGDRALYLDKIPGRRRVEIKSRVGDRHPLTSTGLGKALALDDAPAHWRELFDKDQANGSFPIDYAVWEQRMQDYVASGYAFDLEENEDLIRCVAAPVRDVSGRIVAAISVSSAAQYMDDERMRALADDVRGTALSVSWELGFAPALPHAGRTG